MTPFKVRLIFGGCVTIFAAIAINAILLQDPIIPGAGVAGTVAPSPGTAAKPAGARGLIKTPDAVSPPVRRGRAARKGRAAAPSDARSASARTITAIQRHLLAKGYLPGQIDGVEGIMTRSAIMAFEFDQGLALTGQASDRLLKHFIFGVFAADRGDRGRVATKEAERIVTSVQRELIRLGHLVGPADGRLTQVTRAAIRAFETSRGLAPTGRISGRLVSQLRRAAPGALAFSSR